MNINAQNAIIAIENIIEGLDMCKSAIKAYHKIDRQMPEQVQQNLFSRLNTTHTLLGLFIKDIDIIVTGDTNVKKNSADGTHTVRRNDHNS